MHRLPYTWGHYYLSGILVRTLSGMLFFVSAEARGEKSTERDCNQVPSGPSHAAICRRKVYQIRMVRCICN